MIKPIEDRSIVEAKRKGGQLNGVPFEFTYPGGPFISELAKFMNDYPNNADKYIELYTGCPANHYWTASILNGDSCCWLTFDQTDDPRRQLKMTIQIKKQYLNNGFVFLKSMPAFQQPGDFVAIKMAVCWINEQDRYRCFNAFRLKHGRIDVVRVQLKPFTQADNITLSETKLRAEQKAYYYALKHLINREDFQEQAMTILKNLYATPIREFMEKKVHDELEAAAKQDIKDEFIKRLREDESMMTELRADAKKALHEELKLEVEAEILGYATKRHRADSGNAANNATIL